MFHIGVLGLVAIAACWGLAVVLYRVGPPGSMARKLALLLVVEGVALFTAVAAAPSPPSNHLSKVLRSNTCACPAPSDARF